MYGIGHIHEHGHFCRQKCEGICFSGVDNAVGKFKGNFKFLFKIWKIIKKILENIFYSRKKFTFCECFDTTKKLDGYTVHRGTCWNLSGPRPSRRVFMRRSPSGRPRAEPPSRFPQILTKIFNWKILNSCNIY